jgi:hypothetical protein
MACSMGNEHLIGCCVHATTRGGAAVGPRQGDQRRLFGLTQTDTGRKRVLTEQMLSRCSETQPRVIIDHRLSLRLEELDPCAVPRSRREFGRWTSIDKHREVKKG